MKRLGYWFIAYGMILLGIAFLSNLLMLERGQEVQTSAKAKEYNKVKFISGGITGTAVESETLVNQQKQKEEVIAKKTNPIQKKVKKKNIKRNHSKKRERAKRKARSIKRQKQAEIQALERIVQAEAGGQDEKGRILVANVILNRVKKKKFPKTIRKVIFAYADGYYQFSPIMDGRYYSVKVSNGTKRAVRKALNGVDYSKGALYFMNRRSASRKNARWFDSRLTYVLKHGGHEFFK